MFEINSAQSSLDDLSKLCEVIKGNEKGEKGLMEMELLLNRAENDGIVSPNIKFDAMLARGLDYYTGAIFEVRVANSPVGSICGGGRYDDLCSKLGGKDLPSIGMAIGIERFASLVSDTTLSDKIVSFITLGSTLEPKTYKIAHRLRSLNKNVILDMQLSDSSLKAKLRRANKNNSEYAIIIGEEEFNNSTVIIKPLKDELKEQQTVSVDELFEFYKAL